MVFGVGFFNPILRGLLYTESVAARIPFSLQVLFRLLSRWETEGLTREQLDFLWRRVLPSHPHEARVLDAVLEATERLEGPEVALVLARQMAADFPEGALWSPGMVARLVPRDAQEVERQRASLQLRLEKQHLQVLPRLSCVFEGLYHLGEFEQSLLLFGASAHPSVTEQAWAGWCALERGQYGGAETLFEAAAVQGSVLAQLGLGEMALRRGRVAAAVAVLAELGELEFSSLGMSLQRGFHHLHARVLLRIGQLGQAFEQASLAWDALCLSGELAFYGEAALVTLAEIHTRSGRPGAALEALQQDQALGDADASWERSVAAFQGLLGAGRLQAARLALTGMAALDTSPPEQVLQLLEGQLLWAQGQLTEARRCLAASLGDRQDSDHALNSLWVLEASLSHAALLGHFEPRQALATLIEVQGLLFQNIDKLKISLRVTILQMLSGEIANAQAQMQLRDLAGAFADRSLAHERAVALLWAAQASLQHAPDQSLNLLQELLWAASLGECSLQGLMGEWHLLPDLYRFASAQLSALHQGVIEFVTLGDPALWVQGRRVSFDLPRVMEILLYLCLHGSAPGDILFQDVFPTQTPLQALASMQEVQAELSHQVPQMRIRARRAVGSEAPGLEAPRWGDIYELETDTVLFWDVEDVYAGLVRRTGRPVMPGVSANWLETLATQLEVFG